MFTSVKQTVRFVCLFKSILHKQNVFKGGFLLTKIKSMSWRDVCAVVSFGLFSAPVVSDICEVE